MEFKIFVNCGDNLVGVEKLDGSAFIFYREALVDKLYSSWGPMLVHFIPKVSGYVDGFFTAQNMIAAQAEKAEIKVQIDTCHLTPAVNRNELHTFNCKGGKIELAKKTELTKSKL